MENILFLCSNKNSELFAIKFAENIDPFDCWPIPLTAEWPHRRSLWLRICYCRSNSSPHSDGVVLVYLVAWQTSASILRERCHCWWWRSICQVHVDCFYVHFLFHSVVDLWGIDLIIVWQSISLRRNLPLMWHFRCCGWSTNSHNAMQESSFPHNDDFHPEPIGLNDRLTCISDDK